MPPASTGPSQEPAPLDAHLHVWDLTANRYPWLGPQHGPLYANFSPEQAQRELAACGVGSAILVQAEDSVAETEYMLDIADRHDWVAGVVGWVPLEEPDAAAATLERFGRHPRFCGVRQLVHDDPRPDVLELPSVRASLRHLAAEGVPLDVPDAWPRHLEQAGRLAEDIPDLVIVIDHLAKPPRGLPELAEWRAQMARVARNPVAVAKVSGLRRAGEAYSVDALRPVWEAALELFGPERLMFGSDWPMTVPEGGYRPTHEVLAALIGELSPAEQRSVMGDTARRVYRLR
jgi:L-fuconolactonase